MVEIPIQQFLAELKSLGVKVWAQDGRLRSRSPKGVLTPTLRQTLQERKAEILAFLQPANTRSKPTIKPIARRPTSLDKSDTFPLSFAQQRLWFLAQLEGPSASYNIPGVLRLEGPLDEDALRWSLNEIRQRHEILRTTFPEKNGQPYQQIADGLPPFNLSIIPLDDLPPTRQEAEVERLATEETNQPFDLVEGPLWRVTLLRLSDDDHVLLLTMHHIISDAWSTGVLMRELGALYTAYTSGEPSAELTRHASVAPKPAVLPELEIQYADFTLWQRAWLTGELLNKHLAYWKKQLTHAPALLTLPTDHPRPAVQSFRGDHLFFTLSKELTKSLHTLCQQQNGTLFMTLQAAFALLLSRYSGQDDILIGTPIANRQQKEIEPLIGFFVNTLVLRNDLEGNPTFLEFLRRVRQVALDAYQHQALPFELLVEALQPERSLSHNPLFQVMFDLQNSGDETPELEGVTVTPMEVSYPIAKFDLILSMEQQEEGWIMGWWEYRTELFERATIERMTTHFQTLLEGIVANPSLRIADLPLLSERERHQLLVEWNAITPAASRGTVRDTQADYPSDKCIQHLFEEQAERTPDAIAVVFQDQPLTYRELNSKANQLAHYLIKLGVGPDVLVGICVERGIRMVVGLLAILKAGGAYVPLDPTYPKERLQFMLEDADLQVILTEEKLQHQLPAIKLNLVCLDSAWQTISQESPHNPLIVGNSDNLAYIIYTSGSTGRAKGVMVPHRAVNRLVLNTNYIQLTPADRIAQASNSSFDAATFEIWGALLNGASLVGVSKEVLLDSSALAAKLDEERISVLFVTTALFNQLVTQLPTIFQKLRVLLFGGEAVEPKWVRELLLCGPPSQLLHVYGPTENTTFTTWYPVHEVALGATTVPIGRPIANTKVYLLDSHLQPVPIGVPGELYIGGAGVARGDLNRPQLTKEKFIPNPFGPPEGNRPINPNTGGDGREEKLYKTGDLCRYLPDGNIEFLGRIDHQVKIRGFRIELGEIEAVLSHHPSVQEVVVVVIDSGGPSGPGKRLVAYLVGEAVGAYKPLRGYLAKKLPDYMIPSAFVQLEAMPLTPNGKIDRRALPAPDASTLASETSFVAPRNSIELQLAQIWSEVLGVSPIGVQDNFFDLGGHSLLAVRLMAQISQQFGQHLPLATLFRANTIEKLTILLGEEITSQFWSPLVAIQPKGSKAPFFCMPGSGGNVVYYHQLARHLDEDRPFYALQPPSLDGVSAPFYRVEEIATYYVEAIQTIQPNGPYFLGGHSFGADVAFEMAQQLQKQGEKVALLALLDHPARLPGNTPKQLDWDDAQWLTVIAGILEMLSGKKLGISAETLQPLAPAAQLDYLKQRMEAVNLLPSGSRIERVRGIVQTIKADELAFVGYVPSRGYEGPITLFRTRSYNDELGFFGEFSKDSTWGWNQLSSLPVHVHVVPGNHTTILSHPHVQVLAEKLKVCLEENS